MSQDRQPGTRTELASELFTRESDIQVTRWDRIKRILDATFYAPLKIGWMDFRTRIGGIIILFYLLLGIVGPLLVSEPRIGDAPQFAPPFLSLDYIMGADQMGRALHKQAIHATPPMLIMVFTGAVVSVFIGTAIGTLSGYRGGKIDTILMGITDLILVIPGIVLVFVIVAIYRPESAVVVGFILGIDNWPGLARQLRSEVLSIREQSYTEASRVMGLSEVHILRRDIASNMAPYISINFAGGAKGIIFESVGLYYIGVLPGTVENWGVMLDQAFTTGNILEHLWWLFFTVMLIVTFALGFILFAQGLDRVFNVRLQARHQKSAAGNEENQSDKAITRKSD